MRRTVFAAVLSALAVGLVTAATGGAQGQGQGQAQSDDRTIVVYEQERGSTFRFVDNKPFTRSVRGNPRRVSVGDKFVIREAITSDAALTQRVGTFMAECTATNGTRRFDRVLWLCTGAYQFGDGTITLAGVVRLSEGENTFNVAVTGGTGAYEGERGQVTIHDPAGDAPSQDTIHLMGAR